MTSATGEAPRVLVLLTSLCAEGTPVLALGMCKRWLAGGIEPILVTLAKEPADLAPEFEGAGIRHQCLHVSARGRCRYGVAAMALREVSRTSRAAAILSFPLGWHVPAAVAGKMAGVPVVAAHVGNYPPYWLGRALWKFRLQMTLGRWAGVKLICCSSYVRQGVIEHFGYPASRAEVVYNGCDVEGIGRRAEGSRRARRRNGAPLRIGMVARLEMHKDQPRLICAAEILKRRGRKVVVELVGEGSRRQEYLRLIRDLRVEDSVFLLGMRRDVPELLGSWDAFAFAAKRDEGFGIALAEAMAAGTPIVAADVGACREVLLDGRLGLLVPADSAEALANGIEVIEQGPDEACLRASAAREHAARNFSIDRMAAEYARLLGVS